MPRMPNNFSRSRLTNASFPMPEPGETMHVVISSEWGGQNTILQTRLWEIRKGHLLLQQTDPPLTKEEINKELQLSYLVTFNMGEPARVGFNAPLLTIVDLPGDRGQIMLVTVPEKVKPMSLRAYSRIAPAPGVKISSSLHMEGLSLPMNAVGDISLGGARLLHKGGLPLTEGQRLKVSISYSTDALLLPATLLRQENAPQYNMASLVVKFVDLSKEEQDSLKTVLGRIWKQKRMLALSEASQKMSKILIPGKK